MGRGRGCLFPYRKGVKPIVRTRLEQMSDKEDAVTYVAKTHLDMARDIVPTLAMARTTGKGHDGAGSLLRASGSAILSVRVLDGTSFDAPPGAVTIAAMSDRIEEVRPLGAPPGAATIAASSGSLLRTSGSGAGASISTPLCFCSSALCILSIKADCAPLPSRVGVRAKGDDTFFIATKERESSSYLCPTPTAGWRAASRAPSW
jgi:hypothetical protein